MAKRPLVSSTAFGPMVIILVEQYLPAAHRLVRDELAARMLPRMARLFAGLCRWTWLRDWAVRGSDKRAPGVWGELLCRKRYADDQVTAAFDAGIDQLVVLGAGLDTRACRLAAPRDVAAFELDLPANSDYKRAHLQALPGGQPPQVTLLPVDFERDDLATSLAAHGFRADRPAVFVWEAVSQYLTEDGVRRLLTFLATAAPGSRLVFTYLRQDFLDGTRLDGADSMYQNFVVRRALWHFGIDPDRVDELLRPYGWTVREQLGAAEGRARYLTPAGRDLTVADFERSAYAEKTEKTEKV